MGTCAGKGIPHDEYLELENKNVHASFFGEVVYPVPLPPPLFFVFCYFGMVFESVQRLVHLDEGRMGRLENYSIV